MDLVISHVPKVIMAIWCIVKVSEELSLSHLTSRRTEVTLTTAWSCCCVSVLPAPLTYWLTVTSQHVWILCIVGVLLLTVGCGERVQPAAASGTAEWEARSSSNCAQPRGQVSRHRGLSAPESARSGQRQRRPDGLAHWTRLTQDHDWERRRSVCISL